MSLTLDAVFAEVSMKKRPFSWAYAWASCKTALLMSKPKWFKWHRNVMSWLQLNIFYNVYPILKISIMVKQTQLFWKQKCKCLMKVLIHSFNLIIAKTHIQNFVIVYKRGRSNMVNKTSFQLKLDRNELVQFLVFRNWSKKW